MIIMARQWSDLGTVTLFHHPEYFRMVQCWFFVKIIPIIPPKIAGKILTFDVVHQRQAVIIGCCGKFLFGPWYQVCRSVLGCDYSMFLFGKRWEWGKKENRCWQKCFHAVHSAVERLKVRLKSNLKMNTQLARFQASNSYGNKRVIDCSHYS